jgi:hypothetical protein
LMSWNTESYIESLILIEKLAEHSDFLPMVKGGFCVDLSRDC